MANGLDCKNFATSWDPLVDEQVAAMAASGVFDGQRLRLMCDCQPGKGCVVGSALTFSDKIAPSLVGIDIACRVSAFLLGEADVDLERLDRAAKALVPTGPSLCRDVPELSHTFPYEALRCWEYLEEKDLVARSMGSLGSGNHYLELDRDRATGQAWLCVHAGTRLLGRQVGAFYQARARLAALASGVARDVPAEFSYLSGQAMEDYLADIALCRAWSWRSHVTMVRALGDALGLAIDFDQALSCVHNYVDARERVIRKGAIAAHAEETGLIALNMRDGALVVRGKGNDDWNCSLPHGAGRRLSYKEARHTLDLDEMRSQMAGVFTTSLNEETLGEAPDAYKDAAEIERAIAPNAEVVAHLVPEWNMKDHAPKNTGQEPRPAHRGGTDA